MPVHMPVMIMQCMLIIGTMILIDVVTIGMNGAARKAALRCDTMRYELNLAYLDDITFTHTQHIQQIYGVGYVGTIKHV